MSNTNRRSAAGDDVVSKPVLVLGGSGFIGTRLAQTFRKSNIRFQIGDIKESSAFPQFWTHCDVTASASIIKLASESSIIVNLAAEHRDDVRPLSRYGAVNVDGAVNVCNAARSAGVQKIIFTSSVAVYGFHPFSVDEDGPFEPFNEYGKTKLQAEAVYRAWADEDPNRTLVIVRPSVVFGEGNRGNVYNLLKQIASGTFMMVGSGKNIKSMAYVGNISEFLGYVSSFGPGTYISNYVDGPDMSTRELVKHIQRCMGRPDRVRHIPRTVAMAGAYALDGVARLIHRNLPISAIRVRKFCETTQFKSSRVDEWGFTRPYSLAEALARTVQFEFGGPRDDADRPREVVETSNA